MRGHRRTSRTAARLAVCVGVPVVVPVVVCALAACSAGSPSAAPATSGATGVTAASGGLPVLGGTATSSVSSSTAPTGTAGIPGTTGTPTTAPTGPTAPPSSSAASASWGSAASGGTPSGVRIGDATPAPAWLGTRPLPVVKDGLAAPHTTPRDLFPRSIITVDELPPPTDGAFHSSISAVPAAVLARSTWTRDCPVPADRLRYVTVTFRGFDGRAHTGELLVQQQAAAAMVSVFGRLFAANFPIERMRITTRAELDAPPTGDGNTTGAFTCRRIPGQTTWSQHALGLAIDVNPFQNPYRKGDVVLPELATAYLDRATARPGVILPDGPVVRAFAAVGWKWGGNYRSLKDYMHFSLTGG